MSYLVRPNVPGEARQGVVKAEGETDVLEKINKTNTKKG